MTKHITDGLPFGNFKFQQDQPSAVLAILTPFASYQQDQTGPLVPFPVPAILIQAVISGLLFTLIFRQIRPVARESLVVA